ncbi:sulfurtransferase-like selenium metabolism protein YedF [Clostridium sp. D2Q-11]|uniref:Sulfurtransferase-like selenium metabolism protein YedF n=1 Tax=Anaeromonas frigoriresistens TaxID=2683708 RepID=A0A942Z7K7_9FIRM|nr:sulfurtransferase-like selenium metabolism protein YedF [Anaeromonas frigoriresistens]MBS4536979.1 sulfurtransferase-like selenium metabolism protein YedF [Anaeromonas frigoriresistens]
MIREIDAKGEPCPKPVIMTKKALEEIEEGTVSTIVDNEVAKENISKLANSMNFKYDVEKTKEDHFIINIIKGEEVKLKEEVNSNVCEPNIFKDTTIVIGSDKMGEGSEELGKILMKGFIYTLTESLPYPATILLFNDGVKLTVEGSESIDDFEILQEQGVEILSCGTCLNYYEIADKLKVGEVTNMYTIVEKMKNATNTITI